MRVSDRLGEDGVWFTINTDHHVMALIDKGAPHFHHLAFDTVDIGQMRDLLDQLARHGRWLGWGPARHGVGGNIASYVRIVEEECFVELYCDMEQLQDDHVPRDWPDDRFSSNTWGPLPPRSYFRFDPDRGRVGAREPRAARSSLCPRPSVTPVTGYTIPRSPEGRASLVPYPPWHYVGDFLVVEYWADPDAGGVVPPGGARARTRTPAAAPRSSPTGSRARRAATSSSTRRARSTGSSSSSSTRCSTARR